MQHRKTAIQMHAAGCLRAYASELLTLTETRNLSFFCLDRAVHMVMASAAAVASSSRDELDMGMPVRSHTMVWKFSKDSSLQSMIKTVNMIEHTHNPCMMQPMAQQGQVQGCEMLACDVSKTVSLRS